ncbi:DUF4325 domain-containing protein [Clostridium tyrobutyricum]|jgi:predicted alpha/beta superfamily hydrolase|uniref:DUF4325 domain-containing protein n=1 Tax=Clostridium tyrobutyricum DIVETGP TaxID=1408889 RepID=W6N3N0_CLOTY|nr:STAS-like domain-containing protein [Clostridium tyrobutyricum]AND83992.1 hypothetical protein CTK_C07310 [Clostridium tyrobutyricum]ANP68730.1 hypothetical protein BA182_03295 [Clostridium tyrobutyricum]MBR9647147.1 STAS-like domain-containing protein [Clostridium tyrobutyricum]MBV4422285.1 STAS-like domain-containing protein [Clostridium tyrobutyricum]MBV4424790.1 STAS-like domain-containing protein [Clostridium tyrobutyricum]
MKIKMNNCENREFAISDREDNVVYLIDGNELYNRMEKAILKREKIAIDYTNFDFRTAAFLSQTIGKLYRNYTRDEINELIDIENALEKNFALLKNSIDNMYK